MRCGTSRGSRGQGHRIETIALHTEGERRPCSSARATTPTTSAPRRRGPTSTTPSSSAPCARRTPTPRGSAGASSRRTLRFAELCGRVGVTFIGPSPDAMRKLGDKIGSKLIAEEVGVPVAPWSRGGVDTLEDAKAAGRAHRLPPHAQGDRRRWRARHPARRLRRRPHRRLRAHPRRGAARVRLGRRLPREARHRRPSHRGPGHRRRPGQRVGGRRARLLGAAPQPEGHRGVRLPRAQPEQEDEVRTSAERLAIAVGYAGAAPSSSSTNPASVLRLLESTRACRSSTHHEVVTDTDLVKLQIFVANGGRLDDLPAAASPTQRATPSRPASTPRPRPRLRPVPRRISLLNFPAVPASAWTPVWEKATRSPPTSTR